MRKLIGRKIIFYLLTALLLVNSSCLFGWGGKHSPVRGAHPFIVEQAVEILRNDLAAGESRELLEVFESLALHVNDLRDGSIAPDYQNDPAVGFRYWHRGRSNFDLFQDHFYDPTVWANFTILTEGTATLLHFVNETAELRVRENISRALYLWRRGNRSEAVFYLGVGLHYFSDLSQPHHAANKIGGPLDEQLTKHSAFERYVDGIINERRAPNYERFLLATAGGASYRESLSYNYLADFLRNHSHQAALVANKSYHQELAPFLEPDNNAKWTEVAIKNLHQVQAGAAVVIYRFLREAVKENTLITEPVNLSVRVKTREESWFWTYGYGTDDDVYFGVELKDGRSKEWRLGYANYDDFANGDNDTYYLTLDGDYACRAEDLRKAWIRKGAIIHNTSDDWWPMEIQVKAESKGSYLNFTQPINRKMDGNYSLIWELNGNGRLLRYPPAR